MGSLRDEPSSDYGPANELEYLPFSPPYQNLYCTGRSPARYAVQKFIFKMLQEQNPTPLPFVAHVEITPILLWPPDQEVSAFYRTAIGSNSPYYPSNYAATTSVLRTMPTTITSALKFIANDPGRQYITGSFRPDDRDWYGQA